MTSSHDSGAGTSSGTPPPRLYSETQLAEVVAVDDPDALDRVQIKLLSYDGIGAQDGPIWARVATPVAGPSYGAFLLPGVGDEVLVSFVNGDPRFPVVVGSLWNGGARAPETLGGDGKRVDRWALVGKAGTRIAIVEEQSGSPTITLETPGGVKATLTDQAGGKIELQAAGSTVTMDTAGVTVDASGSVTVRASTVQVTASTVTVDAAVSRFNGMVSCDTLQATTVIGATYTPGAGNVW